MLRSNRDLSSAEKMPKDTFVVEEDPETGLSTFPEPQGSLVGLPHLIDPEEVEEEIWKTSEYVEEDPARLLSARNGSLWMPDKICKVCYNCEDPFTMYRRRHHCRMCGQIFCDRCSSYYIDKSLVPSLGPGLHRSCQLCHDLSVRLRIQTGKDSKQLRRAHLDWDSQEFEQTVDPVTGDVRKTSGSRTVGVKEAGRRSSLTSMSTSNGDQTEGESDMPEATAGTTKKSPKDSLAAALDAKERQWMKNSAKIQDRAAQHLAAIANRLVDLSGVSRGEEWKEAVVNLVNEVVTSVDPDVRCGDSMDIRSYVKLKVIPGGHIEDCLYVDGVVFRKNVSHKKMVDKSTGGVKYNPRILVLGGGIEFQRTETKMINMDTLIEQEEKYISILVEKIMSLKPDIILVGKAVARQAQEMLCARNVAVVQHVRPELLERISRVTSAIVLPSSDHMIQQYGDECLGRCRRFMLKSIVDDPERQNSRPNSIVKKAVGRGSTYIYLDGCPVELGCTIVLRGALRKELELIKTIVRFLVNIAYHLRLEVAYYHDRRASLRATLTTSAIKSDSAEDVDEYISDDDGLERDAETSAAIVAALSPGGDTSTGVSSPRASTLTSIDGATRGSLLDTNTRFLLSTSLDVDIGLPFSRELRGLGKTGQNRRRNFRKVSALDHQSILFNSLRMDDRSTLRGRSEVLRIAYYSPEDITLGQFLIDNCFNLQSKSESSFGHVLSFTHRWGRINVKTIKDPNKAKGNNDGEGDDAYSDSLGDGENQEAGARGVGGGDGEGGRASGGHCRDPYYLPIMMSSYCKRCAKYVTKYVRMSDDTWKISFGKFIEIFLYNRTAFCQNSTEEGRTCTHNFRDHHVLVFSCEGYASQFAFVPIHAFSLHARTTLEFPHDFHLALGASLLKEIPRQLQRLAQQYYNRIDTVREGCRSVLLNYSKPEYDEVIAELDALEDDIIASLSDIADKANRTLKRFPSPAVCGINIAHAQAIESNDVAAAVDFDETDDSVATRPSVLRANEAEEGTDSVRMYSTSSRDTKSFPKMCDPADSQSIQASGVESSDPTALDRAALERNKAKVISSNERVCFSRRPSGDAVWFERAHKSEGGNDEKDAAPSDNMPDSPEEQSAAGHVASSGAATVSVSPAPATDEASTSREIGSTPTDISQLNIPVGGAKPTMAMASPVVGANTSEGVEGGAEASLMDCIFPLRIKREAYLKAMAWNRQIISIQSVLIGTEQRLQQAASGNHLGASNGSGAWAADQPSVGYGDGYHDHQEEDHDEEEELTPLMAAVHTRDFGRVFQVVTESLIAMADTKEAGDAAGSSQEEEATAVVSDTDAKESIVVEKENKNLSQIINEPNKYGDRALSLAARDGSVDIVSFLLDKGAFVDAQSLAGYTALMLAVSYKSEPHLEVVRLLLKGGASLNVSSNEGDTALILACYNNNLRAVHALLDHSESRGIIAGLSTAKSIQNSENPQESTEDTGNRSTFSERVRRSTAALTTGITRASSFVESNTSTAPDPMQAKSGGVNSPQEPLWVDARNITDGDSAVSLACQLGYLPILKALIATAGPHLDLSARTVKKGDTLLCLAAATGTPEVVSYLLSSRVLEGDFRIGLDPYATNYKDLNPLDIAKNALALTTGNTPEAEAQRIKRGRIVDVLQRFFDGGGVPLKSESGSMDDADSTTQSNNTSFDDDDEDEEEDDSSRVASEGLSRTHSLGEALGRRPADFNQSVEPRDSEDAFLSTTSPAASVAADGHNVTKTQQQLQQQYQQQQQQQQTSGIQALTRLLTGADYELAGHRRPKAVDIHSDQSIFGSARLGLPVGCNGEVVSVHEDEVASVIAYTLSSLEYRTQLSHHMQSFLYDEGLATQEDNLKQKGGEDHHEQSIHGPESEEARDASVPVVVARAAEDQNPPSTDSAPDQTKQSHDTIKDGSTIDAEAVEGRVFNAEKGGEDTAGEEATTAATNERLLLHSNMMHIKHRFDDRDESGRVMCKFNVTTHCALQFEAIRRAYFEREAAVRAFAIAQKDNIAKTAAANSRSGGNEASAPAEHETGQSDPSLSMSEEKGIDALLEAFSGATDQFVRSLSVSSKWSAQGGKSGASFAKSKDGRFVCKVIAGVELKMFLHFARAYFEYMANAFYNDLPTVMCKILGIYTLNYDREKDNRRVSQHVVVMENLFYHRHVTKIFDLKGSSRNRYVDVKGDRLTPFDELLLGRREAQRSDSKDGPVYVPPGTTNVEQGAVVKCAQVLLDDNLLELTGGRPFPLKHRAKVFFDKAVDNDTKFLKMVEIVDYSILVGFDERNHEIVVGIIDYMRRYDLLKTMERLGKTVGGVMTGQSDAPTIVQPLQYCKRFKTAMDKYFMAVPDKWSFSNEDRRREQQRPTGQD